MTVTYYPYQSGSGAAVLDTQWQDWILEVMRDGVIFNSLNGLNVAAGAGLQVTVDTGKSFTHGIFMKNDASFAINLATADPTNPRIDNIVVHADLTARTVTLIALTGTPAGSPVAPAVTQNASVWEISLNNVRVNAASGTPSTFTDTRIYFPNWPQIYQQSGVSENGRCGGQCTPSANNQVWGQQVNFKRTMQTTPTSITLCTITATLVNTQSASTLSTQGFLYTWNCTTSASLSVSVDTYQTVGNCLRAIGPGDFDIHCDGCDQVHRHRSLKGDLQVLDSAPYYSNKPGEMVLRHECPNCGTVECFNTALTSYDERLSLQGWEQRMEQAYLIRQAQDQLHLPVLA